MNWNFSNHLTDVIGNFRIQERITLHTVIVLLTRAGDYTRGVSGGSVGRLDMDLALAVLEVEETRRDSRYWVMLIRHEGEGTTEL